MARQRLRGLVPTCPHAHEPHRRPAAAYRLYGDAAEAGRRMHLEEGRAPEETAAFEERYATPGRPGWKPARAPRLRPRLPPGPVAGCRAAA